MSLRFKQILSLLLMMSSFSPTTTTLVKGQDQADANQIEKCFEEAEIYRKKANDADPDVPLDLPDDETVLIGRGWLYKSDKQKFSAYTWEYMRNQMANTVICAACTQADFDAGQCSSSRGTGPMIQIQSLVRALKPEGPAGDWVSTRDPNLKQTEDGYYYGEDHGENQVEPNYARFQKGALLGTGNCISIPTKDDLIEKVSFFHDGMKITKFQIQQENGVDGKEIGSQDTFSKEYVFDLPSYNLAKSETGEANERYRIFGYNSYTNKNNELFKIGVVLYDRRCVLIPDYPLPPALFGHFHIDGEDDTQFKSLSWLTWDSRTNLEGINQGGKPDFFVMYYRKSSDAGMGLYGGDGTQSKNVQLENEDEKTLQVIIPSEADIFEREGYKYERLQLQIGAGTQFPPGSQWVFQLQAYKQDVEVHENGIQYYRKSGFSEPYELKIGTPPSLPQDVTIQLGDSSGKDHPTSLKITWQTQADADSYYASFKPKNSQIYQEKPSIYSTQEQWYCFRSKDSSSCTTNMLQLTQPPIGLAWGDLVQIKFYAKSLTGISDPAIPSQEFKLTKMADAVVNVRWSEERFRDKIKLVWDEQDLQQRGGYEKINYSVRKISVDDQTVPEELGTYPSVNNIEIQMLVPNDMGKRFQFEVRPVILQEGTDNVVQYEGQAQVLESGQPILFYYKPDTPTDVKTANFENKIQISWKQSFLDDGTANGQLLTKVYVYIERQENDPDPVRIDDQCEEFKNDGNSLKTASPTCTIQMSTLTGALIGLVRNNKVTAKIESLNSYDKYGVSDKSEPGNGAIVWTVPGKPSNLAAGELTHEQITLTWDLEENGGTDVIMKDPTTQSTTDYFTKITFGTDRTFTFQPVTLGQTYTFSVIASNVMGESVESDSIAVLAAKKPSAPTNVQKDEEASTTDKVVITWTAPSETPESEFGAVITEYIVYFKLADPANSEQQQVKTSNAQTTFDLTTLTRGVYYNVEVAAVNIKGESEKSATVKLMLVGPPDKPTNVKLTFLPNDNLTPEVKRYVTVEWAEPQNNGGAEINNLFVKTKLISNQGPEVSVTCDEPLPTVLTNKKCKYELTQQIITEMKLDTANAKLFQVLIQFENEHNSVKLQSEWSAPGEYEFDGNPVNMIPYTTYPQSPSGLKLSASINAVKRDSFEVTWDPIVDMGGGNIKSYIFEWKEGSSEYQSYKTLNKGDTGFDTRTLRFEPASYLKTYTYRIQATNEYGISSWSEPKEYIHDKKFPEQDFDLTEVVEETNTNQITVSWKAPSDASGNQFEVSEYSIFWSLCAQQGKACEDSNYESVGSPQQSPKLPPDQFKFVINQGVVAGKTYVISITTQVKDNPAKTYAIAATAPSKVQGLASQPYPNTSSTQLGISWQAPSDNGGIDILKYEVEYNNVVKPDAKQVINFPKDGELTNETPLEIVLVQDIVQGATYQVKIRAQNLKQQSWGDFSDIIEVRAAEKPAKPSSPTLEWSYVDSQMSFTFQAPDSMGSEVTGYTLLILNKKQNEEFTSQECSFENVEGSLQCKVTLQVLTDDFGYQLGLDFVQAQIAVKYKIQPNDQEASDIVSDASEQKQLTTVPKPPTNLKENLEAQTLSSMTLTFEKPTEDGGEPILKYKVEKAIENSAFETLIEELAADTLTFQASDLVPKTNYVFRITAFNKNGASESYQQSLLFDPPIPPYPPQNVRKVDAETDDTQIKIEWDAPANQDGYTIQDYYVQYRKKGSAQLREETSTPQGSTFFVLKLSQNQDIISAGDYVEFQVFTRTERFLSSEFAPPTPLEIKAAKKPDPPTVGTIKFEKPNYVFSWVAGSDRADPITGYYVHAYKGGERLSQDTTDCFGSDQSKEVFCQTIAVDFNIKYNLKVGDQITFRVKAQNSMGQSDLSTTSELFSIVGSPTVPQNVQKYVEQTSDTQVAIKWQKSASDGGLPTSLKYFVQVQDTSNSVILQSSTEIDPSQPLEFIYTDVQTDQKYKLLVQARNDFGQSSWSTPIEVIASDAAVKPDAPKLSINRDSTTTSQIGLTWTVENDGGEPINKYVLKGRLFGQQNYVEIELNPAQPLATAFTVTSTQTLEITKGLQYEFILSAFNIVGESDQSEVLVVRAAQVPDAPTNLQNLPQQTTSRKVVFQWTDGDNNGAIITKYQVTIETDIKDAKSVVEHVETGTKQITLTRVGNQALQPEQFYWVSVRAVNEVGEGAESVPLRILATDYAEKTSKPVIQQSATGTSQTSIALTITRPVSDGGDPNISYKLYWKLSSADSFNEDLPFTDSNESVDRTYNDQIGDQMIQSGLTFDFYVVAINKAGPSEQSDTVQIVAADKPDPVTDIVMSFTKDAITNSLQITWVINGENGASIESTPIVKIGKDSGDLSTAVCNAETMTSCLINLKQLQDQSVIEFGQNVKVSVQVKNIAGLSDPATKSQLYAFAPDAPQNLASTGQTNNEQIVIEWSKPDQENGAPVTHYFIYWKNKDDNEYQQLNLNSLAVKVDAPTTTYKVTQLTDQVSIEQGKEYNFQVTAVNTIGESVKSNSVLIRAASGPSPPSEVTVTPNADKQTIQVKWSIPELNGSVLKGYEVWIQKKDSQSFAIAECDFVNIKDIQCTIQTSHLSLADTFNLNMGDTIVAKVKVQSESGSSDLSNPGENLWAYPPSQPYSFKEIIEEASGSQVALEWMKPQQNNGAEVTKYQILWRTNDQSEFNSVSQVLAIDRKDNLRIIVDQNAIGQPIVAGMKYFFKIQAWNVKGWGEWTEEVSAIAVKKPDAPPRPSIELDKQADKVTVSWGEHELQGSVITGYQVEVKDSNGEPQSVTCSNSIADIKSARKCEFTISSLKAEPFKLVLGNQIMAKVRADSTQGFSDWSHEDSKLFAFAPLASTDFQSDSELTSATQVGLKWTLADSQGSPLTKQEYRWKRSDTDSWSDFVLIESATTVSLTLTELPQGNPIIAGSSFDFELIATNGEGSGEAAQLLQVIASQAPDPPKVTSVVLAPKAEQKVTVTFEPGQTNGAEVSGYEVEVSKSQEENYQQVSCTFDEVNKCVFALDLANLGMNLGDTLYAKVRVNSNRGKSSFSTPDSVLLAFAPLPPILSNNPAQTDSTKIGVIWVDDEYQGAKITAYEVQVFDKSQEFPSWTSSKRIERDSQTDQIDMSLVFTEIYISDQNRFPISAGQSYDFRIKAFNQIGESDWAILENVVAAQSPEPPNIKSFTFNRDTKKATIVWETPNARGAVISGHKLQIQLPNSSGFAEVECPSNIVEQYTCSFDIAKIEADPFNFNLGDQVKIQMWFQSDRGDSEKNPIFIKQYAYAPLKPLQPTQWSEKTSKSSIGLQWEAPDNQGAKITLYEVQWKTLSSEFTQQIIAVRDPPETQLVIENQFSNGAQITAGQTYIFQVRARNFIDWGPWSDSRSIVAASLPDPPTFSSNNDEAIVLDRENDKVTFNWIAPNTNGATITGYEVFVLKGSEYVSIISTSDQPPATSYTYSITKLKEDAQIQLGNTISVKVKTISSEPQGKSDLSPTAASRKLAFIPFAPTFMNSRAVNTNLNQIGIYWQPPTQEGQQGSPITAFQIEWCKADAQGQCSDWQLYQNRKFELSDSEFIAESRDQNIYELIITTLGGNQINGGSYLFRVQAENEEGFGAFTEPFSIKAIQAPAAPPNFKAVVQEGERNIKLTWDASDPNGSTINAYRVVLLPKRSSINQEIDCPNSLDLTCLVSFDLIEDQQGSFQFELGDTLKFSVLAGSVANGEGPYSTTTVKYALKPLAPTNLKSNPEVTNQNQIGLTWNWEDSFSKGTTITGFNIQFKKKGQVGWQTKLTNDLETAYTFTEADWIGEVYEFMVSSVSDKEAVFSESIEVLQAAKPDKPDPPRVSFDSETGLVKFEWDQPNTNGAEILSYSLELSKDNNELYKTVQCADQVAKVCSISIDILFSEHGMRYGSSIAAKVSATNSQGTSNLSDKSTSVSLVKSPDQPIEFQRVTDMVIEGIKLKWQQPSFDGGSAINFYTLQYKKENEQDFIVLVPEQVEPEYQTDSTFNEQLQSGQVYVFEVTVTNSQGLKSQPTQLQFTYYGKPAVPIVIDVPEAVVSYNTATIEWKAPEQADNEAQIQYYRVYYRVAGNLQADYQNQKTNDATTKIQLTGLEAESKYEAQISAVSEGGESQKSTVIAFETTKAPAPTPTPTPTPEEPAAKEDSSMLIIIIVVVVVVLIIVALIGYCKYIRRVKKEKINVAEDGAFDDEDPKDFGGLIKPNDRLNTMEDSSAVLQPKSERFKVMAEAPNEIPEEDKIESERSPFEDQNDVILTSDIRLRHLRGRSATLGLPQGDQPQKMPDLDVSADDENVPDDDEKEVPKVIPEPLILQEGEKETPKVIPEPEIHIEPPRPNEKTNVDEQLIEDQTQIGAPEFETDARLSAFRNQDNGEPGVEPKYFHEQEPSESRTVHGQLKYDSEAHEIPQEISKKKKYNQVIDESTLSVHERPLQNNIPKLLVQQPDHPLSDAAASIVPAEPLKVKRKKTTSKKKQKPPRQEHTLWSASDGDQEPVEPDEGLNLDPESEEILMMIQNLWEKKALGCLSKLDKKLLTKLNKLVADNPKHYSGKIGYLQMIYQ